MTILTATLTDRKEDIPPPEVVSDYALLIDNERNASKVPGMFTSSTPAAMVVNVPPVSGIDSIIRRRQRSVWLTLVSLFVLVAIILGCICMYKNLLSAQQMYAGRCGVRYHERLTSSSYADRQYGSGQMMDGEFAEDVEIGEDGYEKIMTPTIGDIRRATVLHDFNVNYTAIIDKEQAHCLLLPLNRSMVLPPRDFWDLLVKLKTGYYVPDADVVRENYRVVTPAIEDLSPYGVYIKSECRYFHTFRLVRDDEPIAMSKRSACEFVGQKYTLGDAGRDKLLFFNIVGCT
jgi:integral membrane protein 2B